MLIELNCEPEAAREVQPEPTERRKDQENAQEILDEQAEREREGKEHGHVAATQGGGRRG
jgi:hypothetical protein